MAIARAVVDGNNNLFAQGQVCRETQGLRHDGWFHATHTTDGPVAGDSMPKAQNQTENGRSIIVFP